jgi:hypothetical protein
VVAAAVTCRRPSSLHDVLLPLLQVHQQLPPSTRGMEQVPEAAGPAATAATAAAETAAAAADRPGWPPPDNPTAIQECQ